jgi:general L-amino acid transport system substrate-binding protein
VRCGISQAAGFATPNDAGQWQGFDVDFCRAVAVAVFGDPAKVEFVPYTQSQRFSVPGEYRLYCSIHPVLMSQVLRVR